MGEALGKAYVDREFPPSSKARMVEMVNNLQAAFQERIETRAWMSVATKQQAITKLNAILKKIGYPDQWRDYSYPTVRWIHAKMKVLDVLANHVNDKTIDGDLMFLSTHLDSSRSRKFYWPGSHLAGRRGWHI